MKVSIVFMTGRDEPHLEWTLDELEHQMRPGDELELIVIDVRGRDVRELGGPAAAGSPIAISSHLPKPNVWQGAHRVTSRDWWATANARNTGIALARHDYLAFLDDRAHLGDAWLETVRRGERERASVIAGSYEKLEGTPGATFTTHDHRLKNHSGGLRNCGGGWLYGCTFALPLAWALEVNGFEEGCDGLTGEDYIFGLMLGHAGHRVDFVPELYVRQDRTVGNQSCKGSYRCMDKGKSPNDKSHAALARFGKRARTEFTPDLRALREHVLAGGAFPLPSPESVDHIVHRDWYDGQPIREMI